MCMRILVTGGAGFIGTNFSLLAVKTGLKVLALDNLSRKGVEKNLEILKKDRRIGFKKIDIRNPLPTSLGKFDAILHLASSCSTAISLKNPSKDFLDNALGTVNVLEFARKNGKIPVIYASTCKVYTTELNTWPIKEEKMRYSFINKAGVAENGPVEAYGKYLRAPYGCSKYTGDIYCQEYHSTYHLPVVINRMSAVFGKYQRGSSESGFIYWFIKAKKYNLKITVFGNGKQARDALWGDDLAQLFLIQLKNINKHNGQIYNLGGGFKNSISILELIEYLDKKGGKPLSVTFEPERQADLKVYVTDIRKISKSSNWRPKTSIFNGIDRLWKEKDL